MSKKRNIRERGKIKLGLYFRKYKDGDKVAIVKNPAVKSNFPLRLVGHTGVIIGSRGRFKEVKIKDGKKMKTFIIHPIHLNKI